ncbi:P-loop containing nucleoside triphosphate hydrolase protein [Xylogone sp. PMI_703]|nr:P-loop containing nucleoside triphosphate hydrolase protein [Xylogone sp. PMI_703]
MFNVCRRGPASISRIVRAAATAPAITLRSTPGSIALRTTASLPIERRYLHLSSPWSDRLAQAKLKLDESPEDITHNGTAEEELATKFEDLRTKKLVHPALIDQIVKGMALHTMTPVQRQTINQALQGTDIIAQAKTGTGKTVGFLLPTIQRILEKNPELAKHRRTSRARPDDIQAIVISPTRELAEQIAVEAKKLAYNTNVVVQVATGGNSKRSMLQKTQREGCHLLVATPGRLNDLLTDPYSRIAAPHLRMLVLDEADRLLDEGFSQDIEDIIKLLPDRTEVDRQTLLFSATVPHEVMHLVKRTLKPGFEFVQTVQPGEQATHDRIPQKIVRVPGIENYLPTLLELCQREISKVGEPLEEGEDGAEAGVRGPFKAIVYFASTANVQLAMEIFRNLRQPQNGTGSLFGKHPLWPVELFHIHGQLTQMQRTRSSEAFRRAKSAILFSTDVTARGMDFPNVTHVIQIGLPQSRDQYIHRVGRTGRAGKQGEGWIFIHENEIREARQRLRALPLTTDNTLDAGAVDMTHNAQLPAATAAVLNQIADATKMVDREFKTRAYMAALGTSGDPRIGAEAVNQWVRYGFGWEHPPRVSRSLAQTLGISRVPGMNFDISDPEDDFASSRGRDDRRGGQDFGRDGRDGRGRSENRLRSRDGSRSNDFGGSFRDRDSGRGRSFGGRERSGRDRDSGNRRDQSHWQRRGRAGNDRGNHRQEHSASF